MEVELDLSQNIKEADFQHEVELTDHINVKSKFNYLPKWLNENKNVNSISFYDSKMTEQIIFNPFSIEPVYFTCREERLNYLPEEICLLTNTETLDIGLLKGYGNIQFLPKNLGNLKNLENLLLDKNQISSLPESLKNCKEITWLSLLHNPLKEFPSMIYELPYLESLSIGSEKYNPIKVDLIRLSNLNFLNSLWLENCGIEKFPMELESIKNLHALILNNNLIKDLPNPKLIKQAFENLNIITLTGNPIYDERFDFLYKWKNQFSEYGITVYFD